MARTFMVAGTTSGVGKTMFTLVEPYVRAMRGRDIAVGEGVMGLSDGLLLRTGQQVRGHGCQWSRLGKNAPPSDAAYEVINKGGQRDGFRRGCVLASYVHRHLACEARGAGCCRSGEVL